MIVLLIGVMVVAPAACSRSAPKPPLRKPVSAQQNTPTTCGGFGIGTQPAAMNGIESSLAARINTYRSSLAGITVGTQNANLVGVAKFHARDMANHAYVGLVASDGEDVFRRITCSSAALGNKGTGVIAVGYSTQSSEVFDALLSDFGARQIISDGGSNKTSTLSIGFNSGYWMIILQ